MGGPFRLLEFHRHSAGENGKCGQRDLWSRCPGKTCRKRQAQRERTAEPVPRLATGESAVSQKGRLDFSTFAISNTLFKCIALIIRRVQSGDLLDCPLFAIKLPFHPRSSRCSFSKHLYTKHFPKHALLDLPRSLKPRRKVNQNHGTFPGGRDCKCRQRCLWSRCPIPPRGKVNRFRGNSRHFPQGRKRQVPPAVPVEPVPRPAAGESEPFSPKSPALSPEVEMPSAAREACGGGTPADRGGK